MATVKELESKMLAPGFWADAVEAQKVIKEYSDLKGWFTEVKDNGHKLKIGSIILIHGFVMLQGLEAGQKYRVACDSLQYEQLTYTFSKARGKKLICRHWADSVDSWIKATSTDLNWIEQLN